MFTLITFTKYGIFPTAQVVKMKKSYKLVHYGTNRVIGNFQSLNSILEVF